LPRSAACSENAVPLGLEADAFFNSSNLDELTVGESGAVDLSVDESSEHDALFAPKRSHCEVIAALTSAAQRLARTIGDYADSQAREARERENQAIARGDTEGAAQARRDADSWGEGGMSRAITHAVGQGVVGALAGNAATGVQAGVGAGA
jgi:hypothetical protein